jgi:CheY-like chemotaxis protein
MMDIRMSVMGGLEAIRRMQELPDLSVVPVIAVSAGVTQDEQIDCIAAGARAFLSKPIEVEPMLQEIGRLLSLTWIPEASAHAAHAASDGMRTSDRFEIPEPAQMEMLRELARAGNMRAIREKADELAALNEDHRPFADRITKLAIGYESKALLRLVEKYAAEQQTEHMEQETNS